MDRVGSGALCAIALGAVAGIFVAPQSGRRILLGRARRETARIGTYAREASAALIDALPELVEAAERALATAVAAFAQPFRTPSPTARLEAALSNDPSLGRRAIWVDAHGATLLLHGLVEDDEEWRNADQLARQMSPDGTVRNLLQVRHKAQSE